MIERWAFEVVHHLPDRAAAPGIPLLGLRQLRHALRTTAPMRLACLGRLFGPFLEATHLKPQACGATRSTEHFAEGPLGVGSCWEEAKANCLLGSIPHAGSSLLAGSNLQTLISCLSQPPWETCRVPFSGNAQLAVEVNRNLVSGAVAT